MYELAYHEKSLTNKSFLVTGGAGFIGSNLVEYLLKYGAKKVRVLDNLSTGYLDNLKDFIDNPAFEFFEGDIRDINTCQDACKNIDYVTHQAALGSVPRSINDPITTNNVNISGFLNMLVAVRDQGVKRMVYAASSSTYGDSIELPKVEERIGKPLSPYAVTKYVNELYADVFAKTYSMELIGLRYFNVFGPRQRPDGPYAAVIPLFIRAAKKGARAVINGDGETTRDFTFVENVVQCNVKALFTNSTEAVNQVYNVGCCRNVTLNNLWTMITKILDVEIPLDYKPERAGDIKSSLASIEKITKYLGYSDWINVEDGLKKLLSYEIKC